MSRDLWANSGKIDGSRFGLSRATDMTDGTQPIAGQAIVAIIEREGRYLMIRRSDAVRAGGMWCFVGGRIEEGESQEQALVREVREEVGLAVEPGRKVWQCLSSYKEWVLHCWTVRLLSDQIHANPREVSDCRWLALEQIFELPRLMPSVKDYFRSQGLL